MTRTHRPLAPLIARQVELAALEHALDTARQNAGCVRVVAGRAGMGKSRLAQELIRRAEATGCAVLWGGCSEVELALPFLPFNEAIGTYLVTADHQQLRQELGPLAEAVGAIVPQLSAKAPTPDDPSNVAIRLQLFEGVVALLRTV